MPPVKAVKTRSVSRLTMDLDQGTYQRLQVALKNHNDARGKHDAFLHTTTLLRGMLGTWLYRSEHPRPPTTAWGRI